MKYSEILSTTLTNSEQQHCCIHICLFSRRIYDQCWLFALQGASNLLPCWVRSQPSVRIFIPSTLTLTHCWFTNSPALFVLPLPHFAASDTTEDASCLLLLFRWFHDKDGTVEEKNTEGFWGRCSFQLLTFHGVDFPSVSAEKCFYTVIDWFTVWKSAILETGGGEHMPMTANFKSSNSCKQPKSLV